MPGAATSYRVDRLHRSYGGFVKRQDYEVQGSEIRCMTYLLTAAALAAGAILIFSALTLIQRGEERRAVRILVAIATAGLIWAALLGMAQLRLAHDRHYCGGASGGSVDQSCITRRESVRWGPYHLFGSNFQGD
jgi:hypothetical protein